MNAEQAAALRAPFPPEQVGKIPKAGTQLDYVGHAAVTDRLLSVDPEWTWAPAGTSQYVDVESFAPTITERGNDSVLWIRLTVCGVTRYGVGIVATKSFELEKQLISDAIRNAAMRFGVALDLWSKEDLHANENGAEASDSPRPTGGSARTRRGSEPSVRAAAAPSPAANSVGEHPVAGSPESSSPIEAPGVSKARREKLKSRCVALQADGVSVADEREKYGLPLVDSCNDSQMQMFEHLVSELEAELAAPFKVDA